MPSGQLEARLKQLCEQALKTEQRELRSVLQELRATLHEYNELMRKLTAEASPSRPQRALEGSLRKGNGHSVN